MLKSSFLRVALAFSDLYYTQVGSPMNVYAWTVYREFTILLCLMQGNVVDNEPVLHETELALKERDSLF